MAACDDRFELQLGGGSYPARIAELPDAPSRLYLRGNRAALDFPALSIIGARGATPYGIALAEMAGRIAAESGIAVVSGGARGCDQAAGRAALKAGGIHIMVMGTGADVVYPASARTLVEATLAAKGAVISIEPWGTPPMRWAFPKRNRIIAALGAALFVAEAGMPSGTFGTAEAASDLGRELLVAPGSVFSPQSRGANYLISNGACCIADEEALEVAISRIYSVLRYGRPEPRGVEGLEGEAAHALELLVANPQRVEELADKIGISALDCLKLMGEMEVRGVVERLPDGRISPTKSALHARTRLGENG